MKKRIIRVYRDYIFEFFKKNVNHRVRKIILNITFDTFKLIIDLPETINIVYGCFFI